MATMPNTLVGSVCPYTPGDCIEIYFEHMKYLLLMNNYTEEAKKKTFLVTTIGLENFKTLVNLLHPAKIEDKTFDEIIVALTAHFKPTPNEISESFKFYRRKQRQDESITDYVTELKLMANTCNFGDHRDRALRDILVLGVYSDDMRQRMLNTTGKLTFEAAVTIALNCEMTQNDMKSFKSNFQTNSVHVSRRDSASNFNNYNSYRSKSRNKNFRSKSRSNKNNSFSKNNNSSQNSSNVICFRCQGKGHYARNCKSKGQNHNRNAQSSNRFGNTNNICNEFDEFSINSLNFVEKTNSAVYFNVIIEGIPIQMEYDSGACVTLMSKICYERHFIESELEVCSKPLRVVTGDNVEVVGTFFVNVGFEENLKVLKVVVVNVAVDFVPLLGRNWLDVLTPEWRNNIQGNFASSYISKVDLNKKDQEREKLIEKLKEDYSTCFNEDLEEPIKDYKATIHVEENATPIFFKPYTVGLGLREKVDVELDRLLSKKIITPIRHSQWASPIVVVPKADGSIRMCIDCKVTINKFVKAEHYPIPLIDDILASIAGSQVFTVIDLKVAYTQLEVVDSCRDLLTINTHRGLFRYNRLPFGVSVAPSIFQETMDKMLVGIKDVYCYLDDILIGGNNFEDCKAKTLEVFERLKLQNVKINEKKCVFFEDKIHFLGFLVSGTGIRPTEEKVEAIVNAPRPTDLTQLQSFLGLLNFYQRFLPNLSSILHPLYQLLRKDVEYVWSEECDKAFENAKRSLLDNNLLVHYDPKKPLVLLCDASPYGVGAILAHSIDGVEYPIFFASSSLSPAEKNYSQLHREALAIIFGLKKFNKYLYGLKFTICSDHQPLREIFSEKKGTPAVAAARLQRWAVLLSGYDYTMEYRKASLMAHADMLSRLPLSKTTGIDEFVINSFNQIDDIPLVNADVSSNTQNDPILTTVFDYVSNGWPKDNKFPDIELKRWSAKRSMLASEDNCLYYGNRLVIPKKLVPNILEILHKDHKGIVRMKALARGSVWWMNIDSDIEAYVKSCFVCASTQKGEKQKVYGKWTESGFPFERVHVDLFEFEKNTYLVSVDTFSKFIHVDHIKEYNAYGVIEKLRILFSIFGLPKELVSDNGPPFNSFEFKMFFKANGITVLNSPAYHPQSNGSAERAVQTSKNSFRKFVLDIENNFMKYMVNPLNKRRSIQMMIDNFHINYRNTPSTVTNASPSDILFKFKPRTLIDLLGNKKNNVKSNIENKSSQNEEIKKSKNVDFDIKVNLNNNRNNKRRNFNLKKFVVKGTGILKKFVGKGNDNEVDLNKDNFEVKKEFKVNEKFMYLNQFKSNVKWLPGVVLKKLSPLRYRVIVNNTTRDAHINQMKKLPERKPVLYPDVTEYSHFENNDTDPEVIQIDPENSEESEVEEVELRRSKRVIRKPVRLNL